MEPYAVPATDLPDLLADDDTCLDGEPAVVALDALTTLADDALESLTREVLRAVRPGPAPRPVLLGASDVPLPPATAPLLEILTCTLAPDGPGRTWVDRPTSTLPDLVEAARRHPVAVRTLDLLLRTQPDDVTAAVHAESAAYSTLLASAEFAAWLTARGPRTPAPDVDDPVLLHRDGDVLEVTLHRPDRRNALGRQLRGALVDALGLAHHDPDLTEVRLRGAGPAFCAGGDLAEFGTAGDPAHAHLVRLAQHPGATVHALRDRVHPHLHGACVGAGLEVPAFADRVVAAPDTWFQLPELDMGLVPGAGGTVSVTRRIGRWRTAWMVLGGDRVEAAEALQWGLVDDVT